MPWPQSSNLIVNGVVLTSFERPSLITGLRVKHEEIAVPTSDVDGVVGHRWRGMDNVFGLDLP